MKLYRKRPIVVETVEWMGNNLLEVIDFIDGNENCKPSRGGKLAIRTLEGIMTADVGDIIIRGLHGELYPCKPDIFSKTYEELD